MLSRLLLFATAAAGSATESVERWRIFELNLTGPAASAQLNPFAEVDLRATFTLDNPSLAPSPRPAWAFPQPTAPAALPVPLVALDFGQAKMAARGNGTVANTGSSRSSAPIGQVINASPSGSVPAGSPGLSLDFGADVADRHVVELPGVRNDTPCRFPFLFLPERLRERNTLAENGLRNACLCREGDGETATALR